MKKNYKEGEKVTYKIVGAGVTTYETDTVVETRNNKLFTNSYSSVGMEWSETLQTFVFNAMGLRTSIVPNDDPEALKFLEGEEEEVQSEPTANSRPPKKKVANKSKNKNKKIKRLRKKK